MLAAMRAITTPRAAGKRGENSVPGAQSELEPVKEA